MLMRSHLKAPGVNFQHLQLSQNPFSKIVSNSACEGLARFEYRRG